MKIKQTMKNENKYEHADNMNMKTKALKIRKRRNIIKMKNRDNKFNYENLIRKREDKMKKIVELKIEWRKKLRF